MFLKARTLALSGVMLALLLPDLSSGAGITLTQSISSELRYESNANLAPNNASPTSDFLLDVTPAIEILRESSSVRIKGAYMPTGYMHFKDHNLDSISHNASADMSSDISDKSSLHINDTFGISKDLRDINGVIGIQIARADILSNAASAGFIYKITPRNSLELGFMDSLVDVSDATGKRGTRTDATSTRVNHDITDNSSVNASYAYTNYLIHTLTGSSSLYSHSLQLGIIQRLPYSLEVSLSGGAYYTPGVIDNQYETVGYLNVKKYFQKSLLAFQYLRSVITTLGISNLLSVDERYSLEWDHQATNSIDISLSGSYGKDHSMQAGAINLESYSAGVSGIWHIYQWLNASAGYDHLTQTSKGALGGDFKRDTVFVKVTYTAYEGRF